jgi:hypothetical protein
MANLAPLQAIPNFAAAPAAFDLSQSPNPGNGSFATDGVGVVEYIQVDGSDGNGGINLNIPAIIAAILGFVKSTASATSTSSGLLTRSLPFQHPLYTNAWATRINEVVGIGGSIAKDKQTGLPVYERVRIGIMFTVPKFKVVPDQGLPNESGRWVTRDFDPNGEGFNPSVAFKFVNPPAGASIQFQGTVSNIAAKCLGTFVWNDVPGPAILDNFDWPSQTMDLLGTVNETTFFGIPRGNLLFREFKIRTKVGPCLPSFYGLGPKEVPLLYDLTYGLYAFQIAAQDSHNSAPVASKDGSVYGWYKVTTSGHDGDPSFYKYEEFKDTLFYAN